MDDARTFGPPDDPAQRRQVTRATVRVLLIDPDDRVFLFQDSDPGTGGRWWILPGGGIDPGESELDAVVREIAEETGFAVARGDVLGPLARRHVRHGYTDQIVEQDDAFYALRVPAFDIDTAGHTDEEQVTLQQHRWWSRADISASDEEIWPALLVGIWALLDEPARWPVALPTVEESSVPI